MSSDSRKINLVIRDKSFQIDFTTDFDLLNKEIISILESELDKKLQEKKIYISYIISMMTETNILYVIKVIIHFS